MMSAELQQRFRPSLQTAQLAVRSLKPGARRLDITETKRPSPTLSYGPSIHFTLRPPCFPDYKLVRENLGETAQNLLGHLSGYLAPDTGNIDSLILTSDKKFVQDLEEDLADLLSIDINQATYASFMTAYGQECYDWLYPPHSEQPLLIGLHPVKISPDGNIYLHCEKQPIDISRHISPLEE